METAEADNGTSTVDTSVLRRQITATIYGQCIGDAIGLLTEFMNKEMARKCYKPPLEYAMKAYDQHRYRWKVGDWTDDSDQMILIMRSLVKHNGEASPTDFASKLCVWIKKGFSELEDVGGMGIGHTTLRTTRKAGYEEHPAQSAQETWEEMNRNAAPNGAVMRTSVVGTCRWQNSETVAENARAFCTTTHYDPRCQASTVAVSVAISKMLQGETDVARLIEEAYSHASRCLETEEDKLKLKEYLDCTDLADLELDDATTMGYTYKCLGAGFWALKQQDFRAALEEICLQGGDADTNGAVAGALLGCKLGDVRKLPKNWVKRLCHRDWLNKELKAYFDTVVLPEEAGLVQEESKSQCILS